jgi:hypothetical protein
MVSNTRKTSSTSTVHPLNLPKSILISSNPSTGFPLAIIWDDQRLVVHTVTDSWKVSDEWWRENPIERTYFIVEIEKLHLKMIFHDHVTKKWYMQNHG